MTGKLCLFTVTLSVRGLPQEGMDECLDNPINCIITLIALVQGFKRARMTFHKRTQQP